MKIDTKRFPSEGLSYTEEIDPGVLDLDTELIKFCSPLKVKLRAQMITNVLTAELVLQSKVAYGCSRCLKECAVDLNRNIELNITVEDDEPAIDLDPYIREEIILDYSINPLCCADCKGLCPKCGKNLNEGLCKC